MKTGHRPARAGSPHTLKKFLNDHAGAGLAELFIDHDRVDRRLGFLDRLTQQHALAQREPVAFTAFAVQLRGKRLGSRESNVPERAGCCDAP